MKEKINKEDIISKINKVKEEDYFYITKIIDKILLKNAGENRNQTKLK